MIPIRRLLSHPRTERRLLWACLSVGGFCLIWLGLQVGLLLHSRYEIVAARNTLHKQREDIKSLASQSAAPPSLPLPLNLAAPDARGSLAFVEALNTPRIGSVQVRSIRFPSNSSSVPTSVSSLAAALGGSAVTPETTPSQAGAQAAVAGASAPKGSSDSGEWIKQPFDCESEGDYADLERFQRRLTDIPQIVEMTHYELIRVRVDTQRHRALLSLKLSGTLYGLPENQTR